MKLTILMIAMSITLSACMLPTTTKIPDTNDDRVCVTEPKDIGPYERCCGDMKTISGEELPDGSCWCAGDDAKDCLGANTCAPCGNGKCEPQFKEDKCSCPEDCEFISPEEEKFNNSGQAKAIEDETDLWPFFADEETGFSFNYPPEVILLDGETVMDDTEQTYLEVEVKDIGEQINLWDLDEEESMANIEALSGGEFGRAAGFPFEESQQVKSVGFLFAQDYMVLGRFEVCSVTLERKLKFYFNNKEITLTLFGPTNTLKETMTKYFTLDANNCGRTVMWDFDKQADFYQTLLDGNASPEIQAWFDVFDQIAEEITFDHR